MNGPKCADCNQKLVDTFHTGVFFHTAPCKPLNTETNTPAMEKRVRKAAHTALKRRNLTAFFEHGQWWIEHLPSGAQWAVNDASGPSCPDGFDFEQVTQGDEG